MKSNYKKMIELLSEMETGFYAYTNDDVSHPLPYNSDAAISIKHGYNKVDMVGVCHATFYFDKNGNFTKMLIEE